MFQPRRPIASGRETHFENANRTFFLERNIVMGSEVTVSETIDSPYCKPGVRAQKLVYYFGTSIAEAGHSLDEHPSGTHAIT